MITFQLDDKNDLTLGKSASIEMLSGIKAVAQTAENYAKTLLGEMIHAIDEGVPYFGTVFARGDTVQFEAALRRACNRCLKCARCAASPSCKWARLSATMRQ